VKSAFAKGQRAYWKVEVHVFVTPDYSYNSNRSGCLTASATVTRIGDCLYMKYTHTGMSSKPTSTACAAAMEICERVGFMII
jgi:hypothetical protein